MLLRCCLILIAIIILRHILYLVCLFLCLGLGLFMSYLCDLFFNVSLIFIVINHITTFKQRFLFFLHFLEHLLLLFDDNVDEESKSFSNSKNSASGCCLAFAWFFCQFQPGVAYRSVAYIKKRVSRFSCFYEIHRFQNMWPHHRHCCIMEVTLVLISFES